ncbi:MAG: hypothetical protein PVF73_04870 [Bacteroidales bacterium]|jgi:hypothetical protein
MKKINRILIPFILIMLIFSLSSCKKTKDVLDGGDNCDELVDDLSAAITEFSLDPTSQEKCEAYVQALENYLNGCSTGLTPAQRQEYQDQIDEADCSGL